MPSPAIFPSAGFVPSSFGPFAAGLSLARSVQGPAPTKLIVTTAIPAKTPRIAALLAPFARTDSITLSDVPAPIRFLRVSLRLRFIPISILSTTVVRLPYIAYSATHPHPCLYASPSPPYTASEVILRLYLRFHPRLGAFAVSCLLASVILSSTQARQSPRKPAEKRGAKASTPAEPENPAQIELLETRYRFEANGDSRKDAHTRVKINSELGVRQFARLNFDYNRAFESIDLPLIRITHPSGGTVDILPSAITDNPNPAVANAPAYQDVRVKSVRILGLAPGDLLEYRVITTISRHPLAPDFYLTHDFSREGIVTQEV